MHALSTHPMVTPVVVNLIAVSTLGVCVGVVAVLLALAALALWMSARSAGPPPPTRGRTLNYAAPIYDLTLWATSFGIEGRLRRRWAHLVAARPGDMVLDLGCGTGALSAEVANGVVPGAVIGLDAAPAMVRAARRKHGSDHCRFEVGLVEELPFEAGEFDVVMSSMTFHHLPLDLKERALAEAWRVLKPGGRLVVIDLDRPTNWLGWVIGTASWLLLWQPPIRENIKGIVPGLIRQAGFVNIERGHWSCGIISVCIANKPPSSL